MFPRYAGWTPRPHHAAVLRDDFQDGMPGASLTSIPTCNRDHQAGTGPSTAACAHGSLTNADYEHQRAAAGIRPTTVFERSKPLISEAQRLRGFRELRNGPIRGGRPHLGVTRIGAATGGEDPPVVREFFCHHRRECFAFGQHRFVIFARGVRRPRPKSWSGRNFSPSPARLANRGGLATARR